MTITNLIYIGVPFVVALAPPFLRQRERESPAGLTFVDMDGKKSLLSGLRVP